MEYIIVVFIGIIAGLVSGVVGTGSSIILIPALAYAFGTKAAVPIMAIAAIMGNISRVILWRKEMNFRAFFLYSIPAIPASALGANTLWTLPVEYSSLFIGLFFFIMIPIRHFARARTLTISNTQLMIFGASVGFLTGLVFSTGPLSIPIFSGYGLSKGVLLSTEAASSFIIYLSKASMFTLVGASTWPTIISGLLVGCSLIIGVYISKYWVINISERAFNYSIDLMLLIAGITMILDVIK